MGLSDSTKLDEIEILFIVLSGMFRDESMVRCKTLRKNLTRVLYEGRENTLIKERYHFHGATRELESGESEIINPLSEEVNGAFLGIFQISDYIEHVGSKGDHLVHRAVINQARYVLGDKEISLDDYEFLQGLGKNIPVLARIG